MTFNKKYLAYAGAGVVAVIMLATCVVQCNGKNQARDELRATQDVLDKQKQRVADLEDEKEKLAQESEQNKSASLRLLQERNAQISDLNDSIDALRDSLTIVAEQLHDCQNSKKKVVKTNKKVQKPSPATKQTPRENCPRANDGAHVSNRDTVVVREPAKTIVKDDQNVITIGGNAQNNTVNVNNGVINNYYGSPVARDTVAAQAAAASHTMVIVRKKVIERVR